MDANINVKPENKEEYKNDLKVEVVPISLEPHPNADSLSIAKVKGWNCIVKTDDFKDKLLGAYIPLDAVLPPEPQWEFMQSYKYRVKTIKLRGVISQGLLIPAKDNWVLGQDVTKELNITKYIPPELRLHEKNIFGYSQNVKQHPAFSYHTKIERIQNYPDIFTEEDDVYITEKIHGCNSRYGIIENTFYVGSHNHTKLHPGDSIYSKIADRYNIEELMRCLLETRLLQFSHLKQPQNCFIIYGEIYGKGIQKLTYGLDTQQLVMFDVEIDGRLLDFDEVIAVSNIINIPTPPILYKGKFSNKLVEELSEGNTIIGNNAHLREGIVIRSITEQFHYNIGRKWLKRISNQYLLKE